jgi:hypothetical protein
MYFIFVSAPLGFVFRSLWVLVRLGPRVSCSVLAFDFLPPVWICPAVQSLAPGSQFFSCDFIAVSQTAC